MRRISSAMNNMDTQSALRLQESRLNRANNQIGSQRKIQQLRDDPISAGHLVRYQSYLGRVNTFEKNAATLTDQSELRHFSQMCLPVPNKTDSAPDDRRKSDHRAAAEFCAGFQSDCLRGSGGFPEDEARSVYPYYSLQNLFFSYITPSN